MQKTNHHMELIKKGTELIAALGKEYLSQFMKDNDLYDQVFARIAESLFKNFAIESNDETYRFVEIEFYLNVTDEDGKPVTYFRDSAKAGEWHIHYSGFDLCLESDNDWYGGILIRSVKRGDYDDDKDFIYGPLKCLKTLFRKMNAFGTHDNVPKIVESESRFEEDFIPECYTRFGIDEDRSKRRYRYTIPVTMWKKHSGYSAFPTKK